MNKKELERLFESSIDELTVYRFNARGTANFESISSFRRNNQGKLNDESNSYIINTLNHFDKKWLSVHLLNFISLENDSITNSLFETAIQICEPSWSQSYSDFFVRVYGIPESLLIYYKYLKSVKSLYLKENILNQIRTILKNVSFQNVENDKDSYSIAGYNHIDTMKNGNITTVWNLDPNLLELFSQTLSPVLLELQTYAMDMILSKKLTYSNSFFTMLLFNNHDHYPKKLTQKAEDIYSLLKENKKFIFTYLR